jgi:hypothetical protein
VSKNVILSATKDLLLAYKATADSSVYARQEVPLGDGLGMTLSPEFE